MIKQNQNPIPPFLVSNSSKGAEKALGGQSDCSFVPERLHLFLL